MTPLRCIQTIIAWGVLAAQFSAALECRAADGTPLKVTLREHVRTTDGILQIKHVAQLEGPSKAALKRWEELDLLDGSEESPDELRVTRSLIAARLLLAGCHVNTITFAGATVAQVERVEPLDLTDKEVERLAQQEVAKQLGVATELVEVRLLGPCVARLLPSKSDSHLGELDVIPPLLRTNDPRITVRWLEAGIVKSTLICNVRIRVARDWPTAARDMPMGQVLVAADVVTQPVWCHWTEIAPQADQCVGQRLRHALGAQARVTLADLTIPGAVASGPLAAQVIKPRDLIRVTVVRGNLTVVLPSAEALQAGRPGERIRLRNLESQRVIIGTVVAAGEVEIQLP